MQKEEVLVDTGRYLADTEQKLEARPNIRALARFEPGIARIRSGMSNHSTATLGSLRINYVVEAASENKLRLIRPVGY
jgi:hypothetical protein